MAVEWSASCVCVCGAKARGTSAVRAPVTLRSEMSAVRLFLQISSKSHQCSLQRLLVRSSVARVVHLGLHEHATSQAARLLGGLVAAGVDDAGPEVVHAVAGGGVLVIGPESASVGQAQTRTKVSEEPHDMFVLVLRGGVLCVACD